MNSRRFHKMFFLLVGFVALVIVYRLLTVEPKNAESLKALYAQKEKAEKQVEAVKHNVDELKHPVIDDPISYSMPDDELTVLLEELQPHQYHEDPFVEAKTVSGIYALCGSTYGSTQRFKTKFKANNHVAVVEKLNIFCKEAQLRYPHLLGLINSYQQLQQLPASTDLGKLLKQGYIEFDPSYPQIYRTSSVKKLKAVLKSKNAVLLAEESISAFMHYQYGEILPVSTWLNSQEIEYNNMVSWYALSKISCRYQQGAVCGPIGIVSWKFCASDSTVCGLDFETIYDMNVMPGMKQDVEILITHLDQLGESS